MIKKILKNFIFSFPLGLLFVVFGIATAFAALTISNTNITSDGALTITGTGAGITIGDASVTSINLTTDGTGNGEIVFPAGAISTTEILDSTISNDDISSSATISYSKLSGVAASGANSDITSLSGLTTALPVAQGGTGATTLSGVRTAIGAAASGSNSDITALSGLSTALSVAQGGTGAITLSGILKGNGTGAFTALTAPSGTIVGDTDTQTLTNKTLTAPVISTISNSGTITLPTGTNTLVGRSTTDTLTNKTISGSSNTISGVSLKYVNTSVPAGNTVANTTSETAFASTYTIPANTLETGDVIKIKLWGVYSNAVTPPTLIGKLKLGNTQIGTTGTITGGAAASNAGWSAEIYMVVHSTGANGQIDSQGYLEFATAATAALAINSPNASTITIDTTADQVLSTTVQWGTASASNSATLRQMIVEILR